MSNKLDKNIQKYRLRKIHIYIYIKYVYEITDRKQ